ncbi:hypothetical protein [Burkholderia ubonensis]|uniref:hypothetical protein n=1 Tax=Burkholderia ubonensis TaxID=101571 RepID=UPI0012FC7793|nr:hypothetical protein [Burkholderia ubonensis]
MNSNLVKIVSASLFGFGLILSAPAFSDAGAPKPAAPENMNVKSGGRVNNILRREIGRALSKLPDFDAKNSEVLEVFTWSGAAGPGMIVATREGIGRSAGCAIYEKVGNSDFELVNGQPFCWFSSPSGEFNEESSSVRFLGKISQSYDGQLNDVWFELFYDARIGVFCDPFSMSKKFKCEDGFCGRGVNKSSEGKMNF